MAAYSFSKQNNVVTGSTVEQEAENIDLEAVNPNERWRYFRLLKATLRGDWETAKNIFDNDVSALTASIGKPGDTVLHIAVGRIGKQNIHFVKKLVELLSVESLAATDVNGCTPLHIAALVGSTKTAAILVEKHPSLLYISSPRGMLPIHFAAMKGQRETLLYLLGVSRVTKDDGAFNGESGVSFICYLILSNFYDIALETIERYPHVAILRYQDGDCALLMMATKVSAFRSGSTLGFWQRLIYPYVPVKLEKWSIKDHNKEVLDTEDPLFNNDNRAQYLGEHTSINSGPTAFIKKLLAILWEVLVLQVPQITHIQKIKQIHIEALKMVRTLCEKIALMNDIDASHQIAREVIVQAIRMGIPEIIEEIADWFPKMVRVRDSMNHSMFAQAIINRHEKVFNLVYQQDDRRYVEAIQIDTVGNNILHLAGRRPSESKLRLIPGAALQMQRELQWFEEVKKFVDPMFLEHQDYKGRTPDMVFTEEHKDLVAQGEKWMKDTANSCTITAALIITIVFVAAITVPGGNNQDTGLPIFSHQVAFIVFVVSDAISLFTSTTSLLMFLSILTSRYAEGDFLYVLPKRLIWGLITLFLSITSMMVAFSSTLYLVFGQNKAWILIPVAVLTFMPITSFITLQFPLLVTLISSTYGKGIFGKQSNRPLY